MFTWVADESRAHISMKPAVKFLLADIPEPGGRAFQITDAEGTHDAFIIRFAGEVRAYLNSCPHTGVNLNWSDDQFFDIDHTFIQCSLHGALFQPLDGLCIQGPCQGDSLKSLPIQLVEPHVLIYI